MTKRERLAYIGVSEGCTLFYVLASMRPEYNRNVTIMIALGQAAHVSCTNNTLLKSIAAAEPLWTVCTLLNSKVHQNVLFAISAYS